MRKKNTIEEFLDAECCICIKPFNFSPIPVQRGEILYIKGHGSRPDGSKGVVFQKWHYGFIIEHHLVEYFRVPTEKEMLIHQLK